MFIKTKIKKTIEAETLSQCFKKIKAAKRFGYTNTHITVSRDLNISLLESLLEPHKVFVSIYDREGETTVLDIHWY